MPAFIVTEHHENTGGIVFAQTMEEAKTRGAQTVLDMDPDEDAIVVRRAENLDIYEGGKIPASVLIDEGWILDCDGCGMSLSSGSLDDEEMRSEDVVGFYDLAIHCCHHCRMEDLASRAGKTAFSEAYFDMMADMIRKRCGDVEIIRTGDFRPSANVRKIEGVMTMIEAEISFNFPGQVYAPASLELEQPKTGHHMTRHPSEVQGPPAMHYRCRMGDLDVFQDFLESREAKNGTA